MRMPAADPFTVLTSGERAQLETFLDHLRKLLNDSLDGISDDDARRRLVPSQTTLLGLVKHAAYAETVWFREAITGTPREQLGLPASAEESFHLAETDTVASVRDAHARACEAARQAAARLALDDIVTGHRFGPLTLRWVYLHCIRETAQHAGHADILREQILQTRR